MGFKYKKRRLTCKFRAGSISPNTLSNVPDYLSMQNAVVRKLNTGAGDGLIRSDL